MQNRQRGRLGRALVVIAVLLAYLGILAAPASAAPAPPGQPPSGPGGAGYQWSGVTQRLHDNPSNDDLDYWTLYPTGWTGGGAAPTRLPTVVFIHGWMAIWPSYYQRWLEHLARKGNIVIFPKYQNIWTLGDFFAPNAVWSIKDALANAFTTTPVKPDTTKGMTLIGHSAGGRLSFDLADGAAANGLPVPKAIVAAMPADSSAWMPLAANYADIPAATKVVCVVGDADTGVGRQGCDLVWDRIGQIPAANRSYVWLYGETRDGVALTADHDEPVEGDQPVDTLDFYGTWKLGDAARDCGVFGTNCAYALGGTAQQVNMGTWSDGVAVRKMTATTGKPPCPAGTTAKWC